MEYFIQQNDVSFWQANSYESFTKYLSWISFKLGFDLRRKQTIYEALTETSTFDRALQWRHMSVMIFQITENKTLPRLTNKYKAPHFWPFVTHRWLVDSPHKGSALLKALPFYGVILNDKTIMTIVVTRQSTSSVISSNDDVANNAIDNTALPHNQTISVTTANRWSTIWKSNWCPDLVARVCVENAKLWNPYVKIHVLIIRK